MKLTTGMSPNVIKVSFYFWFTAKGASYNYSLSCIRAPPIFCPKSCLELQIVEKHCSNGSLYKLIKSIDVINYKWQSYCQKSFPKFGENEIWNPLIQLLICIDFIEQLPY